MTLEQLAGAKIGVVILLGIGGALAVPNPAPDGVLGCKFIDFGTGFTGYPGGAPCGPATFTRLIMFGGAALIALWMWQRELKRQEAQNGAQDTPPA